MRLDTRALPPGDRIPNHPWFPVLVYHEVEAALLGPEAARALFAEHGWGGSWVDGVFDFHHFHSTSHEALAVVAGAATLELGGPQGEAFDVVAGDVLVLPAGTGHRPAKARAGGTGGGAHPPGRPGPAPAARRPARGSRSSAPIPRGRRTTTCCAASRPRRSRRRGGESR